MQHILFLWRARPDGRRFQAAPTSRRRLGGGHAHAFVPQAFARRPEPGLEIILVGKDRLTLSGHVPGHLAGLYGRGETPIDLERLAGAGGARLIRDEAAGSPPSRAASRGGSRTGSTGASCAGSMFSSSVRG
ncbi:NAD(P)/FAD-dependent oxidoreductase [Microvirga arsenatis]|uniref:Uncharacterized protein n=1 Tax=Microvirga arsenatis TaxID=2692265 RepID=A0ABW9YXE8_9HYPH|nr:hypothetical protein [Microvirga arsenatis]NBJ09630.1 hypothetical protein [Microvirga arsenatis]NBJ23511.1 hypothetical protein [Microvirga arsenatis]